MSVRILFIALLLLPGCLCQRGLRHRPQKPVPLCCTKVSPANVSADVTGGPTRQSAHGSCVEALIFSTNNGKVCVDPAAEWTETCKSNIMRGTNIHIQRHSCCEYVDTVLITYKDIKFKLKNDQQTLHSSRHHAHFENIALH
uniref:Chemokine interleukin-8-like domain-containing protein n=1 Tax=Echeneis naucrates TaxID=173247 RepID=A0A665WR85_ECHNA